VGTDAFVRPSATANLFFSRREGPRKGCLQLVRLKAKRSGSALVGDAALRIDEVNAVRPACISLFGRVAELVKHRRKLKGELSNAGSGDERAVFFRFRACKNDFLFDIALHLPNVTGMRLSNINDQKSDPIAILPVKLVECGNLPPERRSGVASEYQHHRLSFV